ncbi:hypothetical protein SKAU_G00417950 [Synaphobranchus kaupii]|uniref:Ig-like domain-containing protein n=1 Tax=Synaphobranchus kaupii TaxID=118154 RepID=A0A9Q1E644_SYNKA|nr:hypothetical protein SKAU_G00417950 [Synaphobranchus kaupii]
MRKGEIHVYSVNWLFADLQVKVNPDTVTEGQRVTLTCSTTCTLTGSPAFTWYRNGSPLSLTNQRLQFPASIEDAGKYSCAVKGYEDIGTPAVALNVRYRPKNTALSVSSPSEMLEGSSVTLTCSSDASPPVQSYTLFKDNRAVNSRTKSGQRYGIKKIEPWDAGEYFCEAANEIGTDRSPHIHLKVLCLKVEINSDSVREGEMVTLTCKNTCTNSANGSTFIWYKNGQLLSNGVNQNHNFIARSEDAGSYSCGVGYNTHLSSNAVLLSVKCGVSQKVGRMFARVGYSALDFQTTMLRLRHSSTPE